MFPLAVLAQAHSDLAGIDRILDVVEYMAVGLEVFAVFLIVLAIGGATYRVIARRAGGSGATLDFQGYRAELGYGLLLGLELLVAADVIRTVALEPTLESVAVLGILVLIRIMLGWSIVIEIEQRWPWQPVNHSLAGEGPGSDHAVAERPEA
jgi:uncharacterized membrane protein